MLNNNALLVIFNKLSLTTMTNPVEHEPRLTLRILRRDFQYLPS